MGLTYSLIRKIREHKESLRPLEKIWGITVEEVMKRIKTMRDFDYYFTVNVQGYKTADEYYYKGSLGPRLKNIRIPTFLFSSLDDPTLEY